MPTPPRQPLAKPAVSTPAWEDATAAVQAIDALFAHVGLVRSLRGNAAGITHRQRRKRDAAPEDSLPAPTPQIAENGVAWIEVPAWKKMDWLWHGFSTRQGGLSHVYAADGATAGELNLGFTAADEAETVAANRRLLAEAISGSPATPLLALRQIHSNLVVHSDTAAAERSQPRKAGVPGDRSSSPGWKADGVMTDAPGILLAIQTADCIPVLVADRKRRAVAVFHAGWRGTVQRIVESGIGRMRLEFGSRPEDLIAAIGPGIGPCCYAVGDEVFSEFESQFAYAQELFHEVDDANAVRKKYPMLFLTQRAPGHSPIGPSLHLNLAEANRRQLLAAGLKPSAIRLTGGCTNCQQELFFSHRGADGHAGRMMSVLGIRPGAMRPGATRTASTRTSAARTK